MPRAESVFPVQLVMVDATGSRPKLKQSKRHGQLGLDASSQSVQLVYPRVGRFYQRKFEQPLKCVVGRKLLRVYSSNGKRNFTCGINMCRLLSEDDATKCTETLRSFGVEVIAVGESMLSTDRRAPVIQDAAVIAGGEAALQAIRDTSPRSMQDEIRDYEESSQLREDTDAIMRSIFTTNS